jgi:hypothetical protein
MTAGLLPPSWSFDHHDRRRRDLCGRDVRGHGLRDRGLRGRLRDCCGQRRLRTCLGGLDPGGRPSPVVAVAGDEEVGAVELACAVDILDRKVAVIKLGVLRSK